MTDIELRAFVDCRAEASDSGKPRWKVRRDADPETYRKRKAENARRFRAKNKEKVKAAKRRYYERNKAQVNARADKWRRLNPERRREITLAWRRRNPESCKDAQIRCAYGIGLAEYRQMISDQDGKCLICEKRKKLTIDHCHETGVVRGLLCFGCNSAIGKLGDTAATVARAVAYLTAAEQRRAVERAS